MAAPQYVAELSGLMSPALFGLKAKRLGRLREIGIPVAKGFAVSADAYKDFFKSARLGEWLSVNIFPYLSQGTHMITSEEALDYSNKIREYIVDTCYAEKGLPDKIKQEILTAYKHLKGSPVAIRPSDIYPDEFDDPDTSKHECYLNIRGEEALLKHIVLCWANSLSPKVIFMLAEKGHGFERTFDIRDPVVMGNPAVQFGMARIGTTPEQLALPVIVQQFIPYDVTGIAHRTENGSPYISIRAIYGLCAGLILDRYCSDEKETQGIVKYELDKKMERFLKNNEDVDYLSSSEHMKMIQSYYDSSVKIRKGIKKGGKPSFKRPKQSTLDIKLLSPSDDDNDNIGTGDVSPNNSEKIGFTLKNIQKFYKLEVVKNHPSVMETFISEDISLYSRENWSNNNKNKSIDNRMSTFLASDAKFGVLEQVLKDKKMEKAPVNSYEQIEIASCLLYMENIFKVSLSVEFGISYQQSIPVFHILDIKSIPLSPNIISTTSLHSLFSQSFPNDELSLSIATEMLCSLFPFLRGPLSCKNGRLCIDENVVYSRWFKWAIKGAPILFNISLNDSSYDFELLDDENDDILKGKGENNEDLDALLGSESSSDESDENKDGEQSFNFVVECEVEKDDVDNKKKFYDNLEAKKQQKKKADLEAQNQQNILGENDEKKKLPDYIIQNRKIKKKMSRKIFRGLFKSMSGLKSSIAAIYKGKIPSFLNSKEQLDAKIPPPPCDFIRARDAKNEMKKIKVINDTHNILCRIVDKINKSMDQVLNDVKEKISSLQKNTSGDALKISIIESIDLIISFFSDKRIKESLIAAAAYDGACFAATKMVNHFANTITMKGFGNSKIYPPIDEQEAFNASLGIPPEKPHLRFGDIQTIIPPEMSEYIDAIMHLDSYKSLKDTGRQTYIYFEKLLGEIIESSRTRKTMCIGSIGTYPPYPFDNVENMQIPTVLEIMDYVDIKSLSSSCLLGGLGGFGPNNFGNSEYTMEKRLVKYLRNMYTLVFAKKNNIDNPMIASKVLDSSAVNNNINVLVSCIKTMVTNFPNRIMSMFGSFISGIPLEFAPGCILLAIKNRLIACEFNTHLNQTNATTVEISDMARMVKNKDKTDEEEKMGDKRKEQIEKEKIKIDILSKSFSPYLLHALLTCYYDSNISSLQNTEIYSSYTILAFRHSVASNLFQPLLVYYSHIMKQLLQLSYIAALRFNISNFLTPTVQSMMLKIKDRLNNIKISTIIPSEYCDVLNNILSHLFLGESINILSASLSNDISFISDILDRVKRVGYNNNSQQMTIASDVSRFVSRIHKSRVLKGVANVISFYPTALNTTNLGLNKNMRNKILVPMKPPFGVATKVLPMRIACYDVPIVVVGENAKKKLPLRSVGLAYVVNPTEDPSESLRFLKPLAISINRFSKASEGRFPPVTGLILVLRSSADLSTGLEFVFKCKEQGISLPVLGIVCVGTKYSIECPRQEILDGPETKLKKLSDSFNARLKDLKSKVPGAERKKEILMKKVMESDGNSLKSSKLDLPTQYPLFSIGYDLLNIALSNDVPVLLGVTETCLCPPTSITTGSILELHFIGSLENENSREVIASACLDLMPDEEREKLISSIPSGKETKESLVRLSEWTVPQAVIGQLDAKDFFEYVLSQSSQTNCSFTRDSLEGQKQVTSSFSIPRPPSTLMSYSMTMRQSSYRATRSSRLSRTIGSSHPVFSFSNSTRRISTAIASMSSIRDNREELYSSITGHTSSLSRYYNSEMDGDLLSSIRLSSHMLTPRDSAQTVSRFIRQQYSSSLGRKVLHASEKEHQAARIIENAYKSYSTVINLKNEIKRESLLKELTSYERDYKMSLQILRDTYLSMILELFPNNKKIKKTEEEIVNICRILMDMSGEMLETSVKCNKVFDEIEKEWDRLKIPQVKFCKRIENALMSIDVYGKYSLDYQKYLNILMDENMPKKIHKLITNIPDDTGNQPIDFYLIRPVQHLFKYQLIAGKLLKYTTKIHPDYHDTESLDSYIKGSLDKMESTLNSAIQTEKVVQISARVDGLDASFIKKGRYFIKESSPMSISVTKLGDNYVKSLTPYNTGETLLVPSEINKDYKEIYEKLLSPPETGSPILQSSIRIPDLPYPRVLLLLQFNDCLLVVRQITEEEHKKNNSNTRRLLRHFKKHKMTEELRKRDTSFLPEQMGSLDEMNPLKNEFYECVALLNNYDTKLITASIVSGDLHQTFQLKSPNFLVTSYCQIFEDYISWIQDIEKTFSRE